MPVCSSCMVTCSPNERPLMARAGHERATRRVVGSRDASDGPGKRTEPRAGADPEVMEHVAAICARMLTTARAPVGRP